MARTRSAGRAGRAKARVEKTPGEQVESKMIDSIFEETPAAEQPTPTQETAVEPVEPVEVPKQTKAREVGPATQKVIDRIRELYEEQGLGFPSIAKTLNEEGVQTFRGGQTWHPPVVRNIVIRHGWTKGEKAKPQTNEA